MHVVTEIKANIVLDEVVMRRTLTNKRPRKTLSLNIRAPLNITVFLFSHSNFLRDGDHENMIIFHRLNGSSRPIYRILTSKSGLGVSWISIPSAIDRRDQSRTHRPSIVISFITVLSRRRSLFSLLSVHDNR